MIKVLGIDGWRGSWVAARVALDGSKAEFMGWRTGPIGELFADDDQVIGVDMPVGLPEQGPRRCDLAARAALRPSGSRVFAVPRREAWEAADLASANVVLRAVGEPGMSAQAFALKRAILEVAEHQQDSRLVEVHPELAFLQLTGRVLPAKKTAVGVAARLEALGGWLDVLAALADAPARVPVDDALDALAAAWTAGRVARGEGQRYPSDGGDPDRAGRLMCIYA